MPDLQWIAPSLGMSVRLTIEQDVWAHASQEFPWLLQDSVFGEGPIGAHLIFCWQKACNETRRFGHYNLLVPSTVKADVTLSPDATCLQFHCYDGKGHSEVFPEQLVNLESW